jgi:hypothetical protein
MPVPCLYAAGIPLRSSQLRGSRKTPPPDMSPPARGILEPPARRRGSPQWVTYSHILAFHSLFGTALPGLTPLSLFLSADVGASTVAGVRVEVDPATGAAMPICAHFSHLCHSFLCPFPFHIVIRHIWSFFFVSATVPLLKDWLTELASEIGPERGPRQAATIAPDTTARTPCI